LTAGGVPRLLALLSIVLCLSAAVYLRAWSLGEQVVQGDERFTLEVAAQHDPWYVVSHHHKLAYSIPLALWDQLLISTVGLDEWGMRLPLLLAGLALVPLLVAYAWKRFGMAVGLTAGWIAALSPVLLLYSRFARPYMGMILLVFLALWLWEAWIRTHQLRFGLPAAAAGALAVYLHFMAAPAIFALWALGLVREIRQARQQWFATLKITALGAGLFLLMIWPSMSQLTKFVSSKQGAQLPGWEAWWNTAHFLLGTNRNAVLLWLLITVVVGAVRCARLKPRLAELLLAMIAAQILAVLILGPHFTIWYYVLGRYLLAAMPAIVILVALGLDGHALGLCRLLRVSGNTLRIAVPPLLVLVVTLLGPLPIVYRSHNGFTSHPDYYAPPLPRLIPERVPAFYRFLADLTDDVVLGEAPHTTGWFQTIQGFYQNIHRKEIKVLTDQAVFHAPGMRFKSLLPFGSAGCAAEELDYVIVHKRFLEEASFVDPAPHVRRDLHRIPESSRRASRFRKRSEDVQARCREDPRLQSIYEDEWLEVFARGAQNRRRYAGWSAGQ